MGTYNGGRGGILPPYSGSVSVVWSPGVGRWECRYLTCGQNRHGVLRES
jgi:hypothetical protein